MDGNDALSAEAVATRFKELPSRVDEGISYLCLLHFNVGPFLIYVTTDRVNLVWETDRPSTALLEWGTTDQFGQSIRFARPSNRPPESEGR